MSWHRDIAEADPADLVRRSSHELAVTQWQQACRDYLGLCEQMDREMAARDELRTIGARVARESVIVRGRKTLRVADLVRGTRFVRDDPTPAPAGVSAAPASRDSHAEDPAGAPIPTTSEEQCEHCGRILDCCRRCGKCEGTQQI